MSTGMRLRLTYLHFVFSSFFSSLLLVVQDIGDGWWEAETADGVVGLFPESYCEVLDDGGGGGEEQGGGGGGGDYQPEYQPEPEEQTTQKYAAGEPDEYEWDDQDEWDDQEFGGSGAAATPSYSKQDYTRIYYLSIDKSVNNVLYSII